MFTVHYTRLASNQLATIWNDADDRQAVVKASREIEEAIAINPMNEGESREADHRRVGFRNPLTIVFAVDTMAKIVTVSHISIRRSI